MNGTFDFHSTMMTIKSSTLETGGNYTVLYAVHPPNVGPSLHMRPRGNECFYITKGKYKFTLGNKLIDAVPSDVILVPKDISHKFTVDIDGGGTLIISLHDLENYFSKVSDLLHKGDVTWDVESSIAKRYGQVFLENANHWK